jgi:sugar (pentulose or hexulose) kinase
VAHCGRARRHAGSLRPGVLYRAALEGATFSLAAALDTAGAWRSLHGCRVRVCWTAAAAAAPVLLLALSCPHCARRRTHPRTHARARARHTVALGLVPTELRLVGGGSRNALWQQIVADVFQLPVM